MLPIKKQLIRYNFEKYGNRKQYIVIHDTGNTDIGANAAMHYTYFNGGDRGKSAHFVVDDKTIIQLVELDNIAWHVKTTNSGITNRNSIGIEICINKDGDYAKAVANAEELAVYLMILTGIPFERVVRHYDATKKICPKTMSNGDWAKWYEFKENVRQLYEQQTKPKGKEPEAWKVAPLKELYEAGFIQDYEGWKVKLDEPAPVWLVLLLLNKIRKE